MGWGHRQTRANQKSSSTQRAGEQHHGNMACSALAAVCCCLLTLINTFPMYIVGQAFKQHAEEQGYDTAQAAAADVLNLDLKKVRGRVWTGVATGVDICGQV